MFEFDFFVKITFVISYVLVAFVIFLVLKTKVFLNIDCIDYSFINQNLAQIICNKLNMCFVSFFQPRNVKNFDNNVFFNSITHALYSIFIV